MAATKNTDPAFEAKLAVYRKLVETIAGLDLKGATLPYTSLNGNMFSMLDKDGCLAMRLSEKDRELFIKTYKASLQESHGVVRKEYVVVPESLMKKPAVLKEYFAKSYEYAGTLKAKPTTRSKK